VARLRRIVLPGQAHLIIHRGQSGQPVFVAAVDRDLYLAGLRESAFDANVVIHAYALLDNEVRLLVTPSTETGLADLMQAVGRRYVGAFNKRHGRSGTPWDGRFRSTVVEPGLCVRECLRLVEAAFERHAARNEPEWSSLRHHLGQCSDPLVTEHPDYWALGNTPFERQAVYRRFVEQATSASDVATILRAAINGWVLGSPTFASLVHEATGRRPHPLSRGRPRTRIPKASI